MLQLIKRSTDGTGTDKEALAELLQRIAKHDREAFEQLYQATAAKLFGIVLRILREKSRAEDLVQEIYIKIWERAALYDASRGTPMGWMGVMARNMALDQVRTPLRLVSSETVAEYEHIASTEEQPLDFCLRQQDRKHLLECLKGLEEDKRNMVVLAYQEGLSREELAERFKTPIATVKTWLRRSLESLRNCMSAYG